MKTYSAKSDIVKEAELFLIKCAKTYRKDHLELRIPGHLKVVRRGRECFFLRQKSWKRNVQKSAKAFCETVFWRKRIFHLKAGLVLQRSVHLEKLDFLVNWSEEFLLPHLGLFGARNVKNLVQYVAKGRQQNGHLEDNEICSKLKWCQTFRKNGYLKHNCVQSYMFPSRKKKQTKN